MSPSSILIVEDDATLLRGLKDSFEAHGYEVATAADGEAGLTAAMKNQVDLILLDIMLPKMNGYEICRAVRQAKIDVPIIMLTAKDQESDIVMGLNLGADDYVTKPFGLRELLARVRAALRRGGSPEDNVHRFGDYQLNLDSHKLLRGDQEIPLTPKEFGALAYLLRRAGQAVTRDQILNVVWGHNVFVTPHSIDRCINTLRSKIEPDPRDPIYIHTIRDVGYRFEPPTVDDDAAV
jgi:DNA-binding response OmpR family regulator